MTRSSALAAVLALVMLAGVIGTYSAVSAQDDRLDPPAPAPADPVLTRPEQQPEARQPARPDDGPEADLIAAGRAGERRDELDRRREEIERREERQRREEMERRAREQEARERMEREGRPLRPGLRGPGPHEPRPPFRREYAEQFGHMIEMIGRMKHTCFDPEAAAIVAIGGIRDDVPREPRQVIDDLEKALTQTKTLGLRNAIRLQLRDLYRETDKPEKVLEHLHQMLAENDEALQKRPPEPPK